MLLFMAIGVIIALSILCRKRRRRPARSRTARTVTNRTVSARNINTTNAAQSEKDRRKVVADYNRRIKCELERNQARDDIIHLEQRKADLLKAYEQLPDANSEKIIKRRIAYDNAIRATEKQIEKAYMILHRTY